MANPTEPYTPEEIDEAVAQARDAWASNLTPSYRDQCIGYWMPFLLAKIAELELQQLGRLDPVKVTAEHNTLKAEVKRLKNDNARLQTERAFLWDHVGLHGEAAEVVRQGWAGLDAEVSDE